MLDLVCLILLNSIKIQVFVPSSEQTSFSDPVNRLTRTCFGGGLVGGLIVVSMKVSEEPLSRPDFSPSGERKRDSR